MRIEDHKARLIESIKLIEESIERGLLERHRTIGFNTSAAAADMLEMLLHKLHLIDQGFIIKHEWLKSKNAAERKLPFSFPKKKEVLGLILKIEEKRNILCYGKPQKIELLREVITYFNKLKHVIKEAGLDDIPE